MADKHGVPAFPLPADVIMGDTGYEGMSLRDYFAGQALAGLMAEGAEDYSMRSAAACAYALADAKVMARPEGGGG